MKIELDLRKSLGENASVYFDKSKKAKKKLEGLKKAMEEIKERIEKSNEEKESREILLPVKKRKKEWFEKFHWFYSSDGFLVIAGRDAQSNEELVKKHMEEEDIYFHAEIQGASHCIVKAKKNSAPEKTMNEAAEFSAVFSKAWASGLSSADVYSVLPSQVSKTPPSGESMKSGSFIISGKREYFKKVPMEFALGMKKEKENFIIVSGPLSAIEKNSIAFLRIVQGEETKGAAAKKIKNFLEQKMPSGIQLDLDEIIAMLPSGGIKLLGEKNV